MTDHSDAERASTPRLGISGRLLLLLALPLAVLIAATGVGVHRGLTRADAAAELRTRTDLGLGALALAEDLQAERALLVDRGRTTPELRARVDGGSDALRQQAGSVGGPLEVATRVTLRRVAAAGSIAEREMGGAVALRVHSEAIADLVDLAASAMDPRGVIDDAAANTTISLARAQAASAEERDLVVVLSEDATLDAASFQEVMALAATQRSSALLAASTAPPGLSIRIRQVAFAMSAADTLRREVFEGATIRTATWVEGLAERTADLAALQRSAEARVVASVDALADGARLLLVGAAFVAVAIMLTSALLLRRAIGSIARPLQRLAGEAEEVARSRLPEAVAAQQGDGDAPADLPALRATGASEVHHVAAAFNEVQETALRLAGEQAALRRNQADALTNLGRRNQTLLARQLDYISSLEDRETDPVFLEHLFKLDHLASRMRRNAESLLILAGSETPRRQRTPVPIAEVVRAAMSEVEEFGRVHIGDVRAATVAGPVVIDVVHLLAELIDNALGFSPPETTVEIDGRPLGHGGYQFAVVDHGVGMTDVEVRAANERLGGRDELVGMPTRYLGQYVVAKLAAKTGAMVHLQPTVGGRGVTALVMLPATALVGERDHDTSTPPAPGPAPFAPGPTAAPPAIRAPATGAADPAAVTALLAGRSAVDPGVDPWQQFLADEPAPQRGGGGLARRVPGATLAEARNGGSGDATEAEHGRSADAVRSMLSSFQDGRRRGHVGRGAAPDAPPTPNPDTVHDGRSSR